MIRITQKLLLQRTFPKTPLYVPCLLFTPLKVTTVIAANKIMGFLKSSTRGAKTSFQ